MCIHISLVFSCFRLVIVHLLYSYAEHVAIRDEQFARAILDK